MEIEFIPIDYDYFDFNGGNYVRMIGRDGRGRRVCVIDSYEANFWLILEDGADASKIVKKVMKVEVTKASRTSKVLKCVIADKKYLGKDVKAIRVFVTNHKDAHEIASEIGDMKGIFKRREYDIPLITKYIKEKGASPLQCLHVKAERVTDNRLQVTEDMDCYIAEEIKPIGNRKQGIGNKEFVPKVLTYDIETSDVEIGKSEILMISLYGELGNKDEGIGNRSKDGEIFEKVLTWKKSEGAGDYVEFCEDEAEMLEKFVEYVNEYSPDILTGYFSDGFDLPYLKARADINGVKLAIGIDSKGPSFTRGRIPSGKFCGIVHVDMYRFVDAVFSQYLQSETLSLNEVAKELVGESKEDFDFAKLSNMKNSDWNDFFSYNVHDSRVAYKLFEKIWPDILEFTKIVKEPLFDVSRDRMSTHVENYILHNLDRFNEIAEKRPSYNEIRERKSMGKYEGAFVFEPVPGLYDDLVMFDFTSMYASVIISYNLSKSTLNEDGETFNEKAGFFPTMLGEVVETRKKYKKEYVANPSGMLKARSNAYKLLANAAYGYQGFFGARYYCREAAAATARLAKENILSAIDKIEKGGYKIIYSDTDSICLLQGEKSRKEVLGMLKKINDELPGIMELDLEDFYPRGLFVLKRGGVGGAKKKYALIDENGKVKIRGFETVRRDWCALTRDLQSKILTDILKDGNEKGALVKFKEVVKKLKGREVEISDLMIRTQLRQALSDYVSEGPHVAAAKKMEARGIPVSVGMLVEYYIGEGSGKRIGDRVYLVGDKVKYDVDYYLKNQVLPAVENIFEVFGIDVSAVADGEVQKKLF
ncbi:MAG: DNA-directed DNA polymerase [Nanoarchaeota archaeon]|nr:DNA-directed DNA polymerase [Nanoarchaeota archaeon]